MLTLLLRSTGSAPVGGIDLSYAVNDLLPSFHAASEGDLVFWAMAELYEWADEAAKRLARMTGGFVERDTSIVLSAVSASYPLPARHVTTIHVAAGDVALREATAPELEALSDTWVDETGTPEHWLQDGETAGWIRVWPKPDASGATLPVIFHRYPATVAQGSAVVQVPWVLREYWTFVVLGEARGKESKAAMPEVAQWARGMAAMYEQVCQEYWGVAL